MRTRCDVWPFLLLLCDIGLGITGYIIYQIVLLENNVATQIGKFWTSSYNNPKGQDLLLSIQESFWCCGFNSPSDMGVNNCTSIVPSNFSVSFVLISS